MSTARFAARLNSFASRSDLAWPGLVGKPSTAALIARAGAVPGLTHVDLNYPDQLAKAPRETLAALADNGLTLNGLAMRYYGDPRLLRGAFTNPEADVRRMAIDLTKRGIDAAREAGAALMTVWLGQDGFDYAFQADYGRLWDWTLEGLAEVAAHDPACMVSIEYKPNEPRSFSVLPDAATTLIAIKEIGAPNLGVTLDFAHVLYAGEQPAKVAALVARHARLLGIHLNDGYAKRDDGLMPGAVHLQQTLELLVEIGRSGYDGVLYFDTFPDFSGLDPVEECAHNIRTVKTLLAKAARLAADEGLAAAMGRQDAVAAQRVVQSVVLGEGG